MRTFIAMTAAALLLPAAAMAQTTGGTAGDTMGGTMQPGGTMGGTMGQQPGGTMGGSTMDPMTTAPQTSMPSAQTDSTTTTTTRQSRKARKGSTTTTGPDAVTNSRTTMGQPQQGQPTEATNTPPEQLPQGGAAGTATQPGPRN
jgi:hypothetical protein